MARETSLSAGLFIMDALEAAGFTKEVSSVFPVYMARDVRLPYVVYRCEGGAQVPTKQGGIGSDTARVELLCYAATYREAVAVAEKARAALDYATADRDSSRMGGCYLSDSEDLREDDAFVKRMVFTARI